MDKATEEFVYWGIGLRIERNDVGLMLMEQIGAMLSRVERSGSTLRMDQIGVTLRWEHIGLTNNGCSW
jgi:hypothetical protein